MTERSCFHRIGILPAKPSYEASILLAQDARGRFLMQLRDDIPHIAAPGYWCLFGGSMETGETLQQAALREFSEETGIALATTDLQPLARIESSSTEGGVLYVYHCLRPLRPEDVSLGEGAGFAFLTLDQVRSYRTVPAIRSVIDWFSEPAQARRA